MLFTKRISSLPHFLAGLLLISACGNCASINFDNLANGAIVTTQYASLATFSSTPAEQIAVYNFSASFGGSPPNFICTESVQGAQDCAGAVFLDFTNPVNGLSFSALGVDNVGLAAKVNVYENNVFNSTVSVLGTGTPLTPHFVDLSAFTNVTRIEIVNVIDSNGIGYDDFVFNPAASPTPEPSAFPLISVALVALGYRARQAVSRQKKWLA
jgi:hypothetical protein